MPLIRLSDLPKDPIFPFPKHFRQLLISDRYSQMTFFWNSKDFIRQVAKSGDFHPVLQRFPNFNIVLKKA